MGHIVNYREWPVNKSTVELYADIQEEAEHEGDGYCSNIKWHKDVAPLKDRQAAEEWIQAHDKGWYDDHAVRFISHRNSKKTKKMEELEGRLRELFRKQCEYAAEHSVLKFKAEYIGCPKCGSKLSRKHLNGDRCPLCREDLRSKTTLDTIANYERRRKEVEAQIREEKNKQSGEVMWLVKYEYHC